MDASFDHTRRRFLKAGGSALAGMLCADRWLDVGTAIAQGAKPLSFQLSWIKSIQYGGYFAGIENNTFKKYGVDPTFNSGGPNVDAVANVAGGQSVLGDRPIGPLLVARDKGIPIKVIGTVFQRSPFSILSLTAKPIRAVKELEGKTIAVSTSSRPLILNLLRDAGVDPRSVNIVPSSPDPAALVADRLMPIRAIPPIKVSSCKRAASTSLSSTCTISASRRPRAHSTAAKTSSPRTATSSSASCGRPSRAGVGPSIIPRTSPS